jgi:hypothetical protein
MKDIKWRTWVTYDNFENMYDNVYKTMVEAGITKEVEEPINETGCNANRLNDGKVGGELYIMPKNVGDAAAPAGATTDIHFTLLAFISGTGEPVLCAIIFKSNLHVSQISVNWKTGIDITQDANDIYLVTSGGPTCRYQGKEIPCFCGTSSKASNHLTTIS